MLSLLIYLGLNIPSYYFLYLSYLFSSPFPFLLIGCFYYSTFPLINFLGTHFFFFFTLLLMDTPEITTHS